MKTWYILVQILFTKRMDFSSILIYPGLHLHPNEKLHIDEISEFSLFDNIKFELSEKDTNFEKNLLMVWTSLGVY